MWFRCASSVFLWLAISAAAWAADGWSDLPRRSETVKVENQRVELPLQPSFRTSGGTQLEIRLVADLKDFQQKLPAILDRWAERKSRKCGLRLRFPRVAPATYDAGSLKIQGKVRFEQRACALGTARRVWRESADFVLRVVPVASDNHIKFLATVEKFDLGKSILQEVGAEAHVQSALQAALSAILSKDDLSLDFPKEVREFNPTLTKTSLRDLGSGNAGLEAEAKVTVDAGTLAGLVKLLTR